MVADWIDELKGIKGRPTVMRQKELVLHICGAVESRASCAVMAHEEGIIAMLTRLLATSEDEELLNAACSIISACSGPLACAGKVGEYCYGGLAVRIQEGPLGDGLGAKVWMVAHMMCLELASHPHIVAGHTVLEIGSGCGVCGIAAAKAGAAHVYLTDVEGPVLRNLRACMHLNAPPSAAEADTPTAVTALGAAGRSSPLLQGQAVPYEEEEGQRGSLQAAAVLAAAGDCTEADCTDGSDPSSSSEAGDASSVDGAVDTGAAATGGASAPAMPRLVAVATTSSNPCGAWDAGNISVRLLDWAESLKALDMLGAGGGAPAAALRQSPLPPLERQSLPGRPSLDDVAPGLPLDQQFDVIIGSEVMYERFHADLVAAVLKHRLAPHGRALLHCAVRQCSVFAHFAEQCAARGLRYRRRQLEPLPARDGAFEGLLGREGDYEGGFLIMAIDHADAPCLDWHRDDLELAAV